MGTWREATFEVREGEGGERLDAYLGRRLRGLSRQRIQALIRERLDPVDHSSGQSSGQSSARLKPATIVRAGLRFKVGYEAATEDPLPDVPVIYEDEQLLVVDKPAGLAVHPAGRHHQHTLTAALALRPGARADPAHRLDRETSGLLVCGRGSGPTSRLKRAFAEGRIAKSYLAICEGWPERERFSIDLPLALGSFAVRVRMAVGQGKAALTEVQVDGRFEDSEGQRFSVLSCAPRTGRQHQIRAHLAALGFPLVGDKIYGPDERLFIRFTEARLTADDTRRLRLPRHALHAAQLSVPHPSGGRSCHFSSPLPPDLATFLSTLRTIR